MNVDNITKSEWLRAANYAGKTNIYTEKGQTIATQVNGNNGDAELICEAGNVANETGLSPRELLEQRDELLRVLNGMVKLVEVIDLRMKIDPVPTYTDAVNIINSITNKTK